MTSRQRKSGLGLSGPLTWRRAALLVAAMIVIFCVLAGLFWLFDLAVGYRPILP